MRVNETIHLARKRVKDPESKTKKVVLIKVKKVVDLKISENDSFIKKIRKTVFGTMTESDFSITAKVYSIVMSFIIMGSVMEFVLETVYVVNNTIEQQNMFIAFELLFNIVFSIDYFVKILFFPNLILLPRYLIKPSYLVDLLSILPFYIEMVLSGNSDASILRIVRIVRIFRIFRLLKLSKNMQQVQLVFKALERSKEAIGMLIFLLINGLFFFGSFVYFAEQGISEFDPQTNSLVYSSGYLKGSTSTFQSIPHTMWWAIVTLTTVGYGDMYF